MCVCVFGPTSTQHVRCHKKIILFKRQSRLYESLVALSAKCREVVRSTLLAKTIQKQNWKRNKTPHSRRNTTRLTKQHKN